MSEYSEQCALFERALWQQNRYPELALLYAVPNGEYRHPATGARLKRMGVKAGVPDIHLPVARGPFVGLWIELKRSDGHHRPTPEQKAWLSALSEQGHKAVVCYGWEQAWSVILDYLSL